MLTGSVRIGAALLLWIGLAVAGFKLHQHPDYGRDGSFSLIAGAVFGLLLQRSRFCFFCIFRDFLVDRNSGPLYGILAALAVGSLGYQVIFGAWIIDPTAGHLPPGAHIGPVSWHLVLGGLAFGFGMALSGSCISAHLYRLGEGSVLAPVSLLGAVVGFGAGFLAWNALYVKAIATAPALWVPQHLGYAGSLFVQLLLFALIGIYLLRFLPERELREPGRIEFSDVGRAVFVNRWPTWVGGVGIGILGTFSYLRTEPLGVTAEIGKFSRKTFDWFSLLPERLEGLEGLAGCSTNPTPQLVGTNGIFISALVAAALAAALAAGQFRPKMVRLRLFPLAFSGGIFLGFGAMISLGCTVGTLFSGIVAFALSGFVFALALIPGIWLGLRIKNRFE